MGMEKFPAGGGGLVGGGGRFCPLLGFHDTGLVCRFFSIGDLLNQIG
jgi:hypothetical protein